MNFKIIRRANLEDAVMTLKHSPPHGTDNSVMKNNIVVQPAQVSDDEDDFKNHVVKEGD